jgi:hypothetical protein
MKVLHCRGKFCEKAREATIYLQQQLKKLSKVQKRQKAALGAEVGIGLLYGD